MHAVENKTNHSINAVDKTALAKNSFFQPKLTINQPNDIYEQEADAMADKVISMPDNSIHNNSFFKPAVSSVQRKCAHCEEEEKQAQRKEANSNETFADASTENYISTLNGKGRSITQSERSFFEPRFGYNFSDVQLHTNAEAGQSANNVNALAYTHGNNIVFGDNQYKPGTENGKKLLAHELTHVVQQNNNTNTNLQSKHIQKAPTVSVVDQNFIGPLTQSQRRAALSCPIRCSGANVGALHSMGLFYHENRTGTRTSPTATDNGVGTELHFISSGPQQTCTCDSFKIIQIITTTHPAAGRDGRGYVDNNNTHTPFYGDVYRSGTGEHEIPSGYPDAGERVTTTHSIYDRPDRPTAGLNSEVRWQAEANVACVRNSGPDIILGGVSYGFRMPYNTTTSTFGTIEGIGPYCLYTATSNFERTLRNDPTTNDYDFQVDYGPGDFEVSEAVKHMA